MRLYVFWMNLFTNRFPFTKAHSHSCECLWLIQIAIRRALCFIIIPIFIVSILFPFLFVSFEFFSSATWIFYLHIINNFFFLVLWTCFNCYLSIESLLEFLFYILLSTQSRYLLVGKVSFCSHCHFFSHSYSLFV